MKKTKKLDWTSIPVDTDKNSLERQRLLKENETSIPSFSTWNLKEGAPSRFLEDNVKHLQEGPGAGYMLLLRGLTLDKHSYKVVSVDRNSDGTYAVEMTVNVKDGRYPFFAEHTYWTADDECDIKNGVLHCFLDYVEEDFIEYGGEETPNGQKVYYHLTDEDYDSPYAFVDRELPDDISIEDWVGSGYSHTVLGEDFTLGDAEKKKDITFEDKFNGNNNSYGAFVPFYFEATSDDLGMAIEDAIDDYMRGEEESVEDEEYFEESMKMRESEEDEEYSIEDDLEIDADNVYYKGDLVGFISSYNCIFNVLNKDCPQEVIDYFSDSAYVIKYHNYESSNSEKKGIRLDEAAFEKCDKKECEDCKEEEFTPSDATVEPAGILKDMSKIADPAENFDGESHVDADGKLSKVEESYGSYSDDDFKNWNAEDIDAWKDIDWSDRGYEPYDTGEEIEGNLHYYGDEDGERLEPTTFHKFYNANPIYPPYYAPIDNSSDDKYTWAMADGRKHDDGYSIHDRRDTWELNDLMSH